MANRWGNNGNSDRLYFLGLQSHGDYSHEIKRCLHLGRKVMTNIDSILKSRDITLLTKVHLVKAMVFLAVLYGCNGNPLQCSCLESPMDGGAWWATVHGVAQSWTRLSDFTQKDLCQLHPMAPRTIVLSVPDHRGRPLLTQASTTDYIRSPACCYK